jgi:hypothetical protein
MINNKTFCLFLLSCLALLAPACGEKRESNEAGEGERAPTTTKKESSVPAPVPAKPVVYNFDADAAGKPPAHFIFARTGQGKEGIWVVQQDASAPSKPNVLAQTSTDTTDYRFPLAILEEGNYQNVAISVKFKAVAGKVDRAAGIVFRYQDPKNYYVVRANALEDNYRLHHVVAGRRRQFAGANFRVTPNDWHMLRVEAVGNQFKCYYDGALKITATDETFSGAGKVGLWTKADSVTYFDDFEISAP